MHVSEALHSRRTCRAFIDTPVPLATVRELLTLASRAPSGGNLQPWHVWALTGAPLSDLKAAVTTRVKAGEIADGPTEYLIYPLAMKEPYEQRRFRNGAALYAALGVTREEAEGRLDQILRNFEFFGAPVALFFAIDRDMHQGQWADLGMFMQSFMLAAREAGLHTAALESWALWPRTVAAFLGMPPELMLFCGMALGHRDETHPVNRTRAERAPVDEFARFVGF
jgi:nitroreductase